MTLATQILLLLFLFQVKHLVADFLCQTPRMLREKAPWGALGGLQHAGFHGLLSLPALLLAGVGVGPAAALCLAEILLHYHIDWGKALVGTRRDIGPRDRRFWALVGIDQGLHQFTYLAMTALAVPV